MSVHALIIDDDKTNLEVLTKFLTYEGISSYAIQDARRVIQVVPDLEQIDVIFLDLELPHHDGYALLEVLRDLALSAPIIACTVHKNDANKAAQHGFDGFIAKPIDANRFPDQLQRILNGEKVWEL